MAITLDSDTSFTTDGATDTGSFSFNHTIGTVTNGVLLFTFNSETNNVSPQVSGVTFNSVALTKLVEVDLDTGFTNHSGIWYLLDTDIPAAGTYALAANWAGDASGHNLVCDVSVWNGMNQTPPSGAQLDTTTAESSTTVVVTPTTDGANSLVIGSASAGASVTLSAPTGYTPARYVGGAGGFEGIGWDKIEASASSLLSLTTTASASTNRLTAAVACWNEFTSGGPTPIPIFRRRIEGY